MSKTGRSFRSPVWLMKRLMKCRLRLLWEELCCQRQPTVLTDQLMSVDQ